MPESSTLISVRCAPPAFTLPNVAAGSLVIDATDGPFLITLESGQSAPLFGDPTTELRPMPYFPLTSPGRRFLALLVDPYRSPRLSILDAHGDEVAHQAWKEDWIRISGWIDEHRLQIATEGEFPGAMTVLNPFSGDATVLSPRFPDLYTLPPYPYWSGPEGVAVYDSTLTRAAYFGYDGDHVLLLWGLPESAMLWRSPAVSESLAPPAWSPDGSRVAFEVLTYGEIALPGILAIVRSDGEADQAIILADAEPVQGQRLAPLSPAWSPDGSRIAFWIDRYGLADAPPTITLGLLDLASSQVTDFCVAGDLRFLALPIWSPDGRFIAVPGAIIDTVEPASYELPFDGTPIGWLVPDR